MMRHYLKKAAAAAAALVLCVAVAGTMMAPATQAGTAYAKSKKVKLYFCISLDFLRPAVFL